MPIRTLAEALPQYGEEAYLLTIARDGPHIGQVTTLIQGDRIGCALGPSAARNIAREPHVSLFWPPTEPGGYALIVNGVATAERGETGAAVAAIALTKAVLHRPGPKPEDSNSPCASDCRRLTW